MHIIDIHFLFEGGRFFALALSPSTMAAVTSIMIVKTHFDIVSGCNSAMNGANCVPNRAKMLQTPKLVATRDVGKMRTLPKYAMLNT